MAAQALAGIRVLDLGRVLAAPLATQMLGDLGADIIKVERPGKGDESREYGPPFVQGPDGTRGDAAFYLACNRNKRSIAVDLGDVRGQDIVRKLAMTCDVVIENFKTGSLARKGLDHASLCAINPRLVYCSITGFGQTGPLAERPGYDGVFQAMSGMMSVSGHPDGEPGGGPMKVGISMVDILTSLFAANAIQAALYHRDVHGGPGQHIDLALLDCGLAALSHFAMSYLVSGEVPERRGNGGFGAVPSQTFQCVDNPIFINAGNDRQFAQLCATLELTDLPADPRFSSIAARITNRRVLSGLIEARLGDKPAASWLALLDAGGVVAGPVNDLPAALAEPQIVHRAMERKIAHPLAGSLSILANPINFSATPIEDYRTPPAVGADTESVLASLGFDSAACAQLRADAVI